MIQVTGPGIRKILSLLLRLIHFIKRIWFIAFERPGYQTNFEGYSRDCVVEGFHGAADHGDVHHVPVVSHVGAGVKNEPAVENLEYWQLPRQASNKPWHVNLEADLTSKCDGEDIVCLAEIVVPGVLLIDGVLRGDGEAGEDDYDHDELVEGRGTHKPVNHFPHTTTNNLKSQAC